MLKVIHVLAVGLWFGAGLFFTFVVGLSLIGTFEKETAKPPDERPYWLPAPAELEKPAPPGFREPLRIEQGSRIFGTAVGPMFFPFYLLQAVCGVLAIATGLTWFGRGGVHRWRIAVLVLALAGVGAGWWLEREVEGLRRRRSDTSDAVLKSSAPSTEQEAAAVAARAEFLTWHNYSLAADFATLALVTAAMAMAAALPSRESAHAA